MRKLRTQHLLTIVFCVMTVGVVIYISRTKTRTIFIPGGLALELARKYSMDDGLVGGALIPPLNAYGQVMTYDEAIRFVFGKSIDPDTQKYTMRSVSVWLVVLEGEFVSHVPSSADGIIPAKDVIHSQLAIIFDAKTGEVMRRTLISPNINLLITNLPVLRESEEEARFVLPTQAPPATEVPYYQTLTP